MKVAMFLDVDKTLTHDFIQFEYAKALRCETEYREIEGKFQRKLISSPAFGRELIALFKSKNFTEDQAKSLRDRVSLQPWTDQLLKLDIDKYLVSSGPSYYIDELAKEYAIPPKNVCRSVYRFDKNTRLIESCDAVDEQYKAQFVRERAGQYDITVGIGDSPEFDGPFVSHCTIPLLTVQNEGSFQIANFGSAILLMGRLSKIEIGKRTEGLEADKLPIPELFRRLSVGSWALLATGMAAAFSLGTMVSKFLK